MFPSSILPFTLPIPPCLLSLSLLYRLRKAPLLRLESMWDPSDVPSLAAFCGYVSGGALSSPNGCGQSPVTKFFGAFSYENDSPEISILLTCVPPCPTLSKPLNVLAITRHTMFLQHRRPPGAQHIWGTPFPIKRPFHLHYTTAL